MSEAPAGIQTFSEEILDPPFDIDQPCVQVDVKQFRLASYALKVRGSSMVGRDINDGDILVFAKPKRKEPKAGDVVVVHIDDEVTIKTLVKRNGESHLRAENPKFPNPKVTANSAVQGVCLGKLANDGSKIVLPSGGVTLISKPLVKKKPLGGRKRGA